jgi:diguanylate cyclase (GGDEF)-like protein/PAS domain S-box-containing protein
MHDERIGSRGQPKVGPAKVSAGELARATEPAGAAVPLDGHQAGRGIAATASSGAGAAPHARGAQPTNLSSGLATTLDNISDAFFILNRQFCFTYLNTRAEQLLQRSRDVLLGKSIWAEFPDDEESTFGVQYRLAMKAARTVSFAAQCEPLKLWFDVRIYPCDEGIAVYFRDMTTQHATKQQLKLLETSVALMDDIVMMTTKSSPETGEARRGPRISYVNEAFVRHFGYSRKEVIGRTPHFLHGPDTSPEELQRINEALAGGKPVHAELVNYKKGGEAFWLELDAVAVSDAHDSRTRHILIGRDISDRRRAGFELARSNRALQMLSRVNEAVFRVDNERELLRRICRVAVDIGGYRTAWVGYARADTGRAITPQAHAGARSDIELVMGAALSWAEGDPGGRGPAGRAVREGQPIVIEDLARTPNTYLRNEAVNAGVRGVIALPLHDKEETFGQLSLYSSDVSKVSGEELKLLQELADGVSFGIGTIRAREERLRIQTTVVKMAAGVSGSSGAEFFERLARSIAEALGAHAAFVARLLPGPPASGTVQKFPGTLATEPGGEDAIRSASRLAFARTISAVIDGTLSPNFEFAIDATPCRDLADEHCVIADQAAERFPGFPILVEQAAQAYVGLRLDNSSGEPLGVLFVIFRRPLQRSAFILSTLKIFAARAAGELERQMDDARIREQASLLDKAQDAIIVRQVDGRIVFWNRSAQRLYGWSAEEAFDRPVAELMRDEDEAGREATRRVLEAGEWSGELTQRRKDGSHFSVEGRWTLITGEDGAARSIFEINTDITARKKAERDIYRLAFYDPLTGLPNRQRLLERLQQALVSGGRRGALLFIDLDNFKTLNDTLGHDIGDDLLRQAARRLEWCLGEAGSVARLGGDEFVVMVENLGTAGSEAIDEAREVGQRILDTLAEPYLLARHERYCTSSIGITMFEGNDEPAGELLKRADLAMYQAKAAGRNTLRFFNPDMQAVLSAHASLEADLRQALAKDQFLLHFQPQVDEHGRATGAEALLRWHHPERGLVFPGEFIPLLEETGLIVPVGEWVLQKACACLAAWRRSGACAGIDLAVNVSVHQFRHPDFADLVLTALARSGADPRRLKLELTESLLVDDIEDAIAKMTVLKSYGVGFSLDDFGTGYSSFHYLKRLPLDQLKIDESFIREVLTDPKGAVIARTIVTMGQSLGLEVIAEGVESDEQRSFLAWHGCRAYQGYLFSKPLPEDEFLAYVRSR